MAVYLIRAGQTGPAKIGWAVDPIQRTAEFQTGHYETLHLLKMWKGGRAEEDALHGRFAALWIRGEWFAFSRDMLGDVELAEITHVELVESDEPSTKLRRLRQLRNIPIKLRRPFIPAVPVNEFPAGSCDASVIINAFGGPRVVAREFGAHLSAPSNWIKDGIPSRFWPAFVAKAAAAGIPGVTFDTLQATKPAKCRGISPSLVIPSPARSCVKTQENVSP